MTWHTPAGALQERMLLQADEDMLAGTKWACGELDVRTLTVSCSGWSER